MSKWRSWSVTETATLALIVQCRRLWETVILFSHSNVSGRRAWLSLTTKRGDFSGDILLRTSFRKSYKARWRYDVLGYYIRHLPSSPLRVRCRQKRNSSFAIHLRWKLCRRPPSVSNPRAFGRCDVWPQDSQFNKIFFLFITTPIFIYLLTRASILLSCSGKKYFFFFPLLTTKINLRRQKNSLNWQTQLRNQTGRKKIFCFVTRS